MKLYTASWCGACKGLKEQMDKAGIEHEIRSLDDDDIMQEAQKLGIRSIPAVEHNGQVYSNIGISQVQDILAGKL